MCGAEFGHSYKRNCDRHGGYPTGSRHRDTTEYNDSVRYLLKNYSSVFATNDTKLESLPGVEHRVEVTDETPIRQRAYKTDVKSQEIIDETVSKLLRDGIIEPSDSEWSSPVILVKKKDQSHRMCVDYRKLNRVLRKEEWPIPRIQDILDSLGGGRSTIRWSI